MAVCSQTSDAQKWFPERLQKKSRIIYNAVKEEFYQVERTPVRGEIVTCGRLTEQKNHRLLIDAFAEVQKIYPFATLKNLWRRRTSGKAPESDRVTES